MANYNFTPIDLYNRGTYYDQFNRKYGLTPGYLPEVVVTGSKSKQDKKQLDEAMRSGKLKKIADEETNNYLTESNDNTQVNNVAHRKYNTHSEAKAIKGGESYNQWKEEHPNLASWSLLAGAAPFAVAAYPFMAAAGEAAASTALGQAMTSTLSPLAQLMATGKYMPYVNAGLSSIFAAHGLNDIMQGKFTPETAMDIAPLTQLIKPMYEGVRTSSDLVKSLGKSESESTFISDLDWSPESWFGTRTTGKFDAEDVAALKTHIPEYIQIEKQAKANGTWLKMPDGSTWQGDPRSWVQLMSKDGKKLLKRRLFHGDNNLYPDSNGGDVTPEVLGNKVLWTSTNKYMPYSYGNNHYELTIPEGMTNCTFNAEGRNWNNLRAPSSFKYDDTNDVANDLLRDDNTVTISNVVDVGNYPGWRQGEDGFPVSIPGERVDDYYERVFKGDDVILGKDTPRKSLLGNNGNFDLSNINIYKGLAPFILSDLVSSSNKEKQNTK